MLVEDLMLTSSTEGCPMITKLSSDQYKARREYDRLQVSERQETSMAQQLARAVPPASFLPTLTKQTWLKHKHGFCIIHHVISADNERSHGEKSRARRS